MEKIQSRMGHSGKSFTVMTFRYFHAQRLNEYCSTDWVIVCVETWKHHLWITFPSQQEEVSIHFKIKVRIQCPLNPKYVWLCLFMWLVTNMDAEINISLNVFDGGVYLHQQSLCKSRHLILLKRTEVFTAALFLRPQDRNSFLHCS